VKQCHLRLKQCQLRPAQSRFQVAQSHLQVAESHLQAAQRRLQVAQWNLQVAEEITDSCLENRRGIKPTVQAASRSGRRFRHSGGRTALSRLKAALGIRQGRRCRKRGTEERNTPPPLHAFCVPTILGWDRRGQKRAWLSQRGQTADCLINVGRGVAPDGMPVPARSGYRLRPQRDTRPYRQRRERPYHNASRAAQDSASRSSQEGQGDPSAGCGEWLGGAFSFRRLLTANIQTPLPTGAGNGYFRRGTDGSIRRQRNKAAITLTSHWFREL
jgi:hypothetical protein